MSRLHGRIASCLVQKRVAANDGEEKGTGHGGSAMSEGRRKGVVIYTDGACLGNPGPGGYGCVLMSDGCRQEFSGGYRLTTNNRMEIMAVIAGLSQLKVPSHVVVYSDSRYVVDAWEKGWVKKWARQGWMRTKRERAANVDLWQQLIALCAPHEVRFEWVPGHAGTRRMSAAMPFPEPPALGGTYRSTQVMKGTTTE